MPRLGNDPSIRRPEVARRLLLCYHKGFPVAPTPVTRMSQLPRPPAWAALALAVAAGGCLSAEDHRHKADRAAESNVRAAQQSALGRTEPLEIRSAADTLRRRLLLDQALPVSGSASTALRDVPPIEAFPDPAYFTEAAPPDAAPAPPWMDRSRQTPVRLTLVEAVQVAAANSRTFQTEKEKVYLAALNLDLSQNEFRGIWSSELQTQAIADLSSGTDEASLEPSSEISFAKKFPNGLEVTAALALNLFRLLTPVPGESFGQFADLSATLPLLRGAGRLVVTEPLRQAERDTIYAVWSFERFKQTFTVDIVRAYLAVLEQADAVRNAEENYRLLIASTRRARRLADAGRLPELQVDQARQSELRARDRWIGAQQSQARAADSSRFAVGLTTDAGVEPDPAELARLVEGAVRLRAPEPEAKPAGEAAVPGEAAAATGADAAIEIAPPDRVHRGPLELEERPALELAVDRRLDLRVAVGKVDDAQRKIAVAADALLPDLTLLGTFALGGRASAGTVDAAGEGLRLDRGLTTGVLTFDPAFERTRERVDYRTRLVDFEKSVRSVQELEDQVKFQVRDSLRTLLSARESVRIQETSVALARRRVDSTNLLLQAGRAEIRDLLEAQESLVSAQNALTSALVRYRVAELELQRDLGVLQVGVDGRWQEYRPTENRP